MNGVTGASSIQHVVRQVVHKTALEPDAGTSAAAALQRNAVVERTQSNGKTNGGSEERVNEAFAKMKVAMHNTGPASEPKAITIAEGQGKKTASQQFMDFMHLSPREKIRAGMLAELGITQEQYDAMSPEDKAKIDKKVGEMVTQEAQQQVAEASISQKGPQPKEATGNRDDRQNAT